MNKFVGNYKFWFISFPYLWLLFFILCPLFLVLMISFSEISYETIPPYKLFLDLKNLNFMPYLGNFKILFEDSIYIKSFWQAISLAFISTFIVLLIAYPMAYAIACANPRYRNILLLIVIVPFWTSLLIRIYSWMIILKNNGLLNKFLLWVGVIDEPLIILNTKIAVIVGMVYTYLPFMILPLYNSLEKIDNSLIEAAQDLGCKSKKVFWHITFPLSVPGIISGCLLVFIPAIGEFVIPDLLGGAEIITIGKILWCEFFLNTDWPIAASITVMMSLVILIPVIFTQKLLKRL